jgi:hypothetical protein
MHWIRILYFHIITCTVKGVWGHRGRSTNAGNAGRCVEICGYMLEIFTSA